tara:strand:+ start:873 stop:1241 length:369 start_codon:yes stop_codon:yes gene_type:complete
MTYYIINSSGVVQGTTSSLDVVNQNLKPDRSFVELSFPFLESLSHIGRTIVDGELVELTPEEILLKRREERAEEFSNTLDLMHSIWYSDLTVEQQSTLTTWRQSWLDYPNTGIKPERPEGIF